MSRKLRHRSQHHSQDGHHEEDTEAVPNEQEELAMLAYEYWQKRGSPHGSSEEDWLKAEEELKRRAEAAARL